MPERGLTVPTSIPLSDLSYGPDEEAAVLRVLRSRWLSMGPEVQAFESEMREMLQVEHALAVSSATAALHLSYLALGIGEGDEVIQPALNFVAAANTTVAVGATPVFADIVSLDEPTIDPRAVARLMTPRTRAVVAMHYGGYPARMAELLALCRQHGVALIEDACHAVGAAYIDDARRPPHGLRCGSIGDVGCFSFFSNKNMATGEGGMVVTSRADVADRLRLLRSHGMTTLTWERHRGHASSYDVMTHGFNYRLDELHAALGRCQLVKLTENNRMRRAVSERYHRQLQELPGWIVPFANHRGDSAHHLQVVTAPDRSARDRTVAALRAQSIQTSLHYPCVPDFTAFARYGDADVPRSRLFAGRAITLPLFPALAAEQVDRVCAQIQVAAAMEESPSHDAVEQL
jgi:dTDP-4-amino-4,6-dideoxygalactose transaminase